MRLSRWARLIHDKRDGLKKRLLEQLAFLFEVERDDNILQEIIEIKLLLNGEIDKDELFLKQRVRVNWFKVGDKNTSFFHKWAS